jgi:ABC-type sugar transport system substrate-binding protein
VGVRHSSWLKILSVGLVAVTASACGGSSSGGGGGDSQGTGELKSITVLMPSSSNNYLAEWQRGFQDRAKDKGVDVQIVENNFDQSEQDIQVQQALSGGEQPDAYIFWPADSRAGVAALRQLSKSGTPTIVVNQPPPPEAEQFMTFYSGVNDFLNGQVSGELMTTAREKLQATKPLSSEGGNLLEIKFVAGYQASEARSDGFADTTKDAPFNILASEYAGFDNESGYKVTSQLIAANRDKGIDFVYAHNDALAAGAIRALEEAGYKPGQDVMVVGGTCHGELSALETGKQFGTGLQAAYLEGLYTVTTVERYFDNDGKVVDGEVTAEASDELKEVTDPPSKYNYIPNPAMEFAKTPEENKKILDETKLWGYTMRDLCTY